MADVQAVADRIQQESAFLREVVTQVEGVIVGQRALVDSMLIGLLADGHVLLEGLPGLAKSLAVQSLATALGGTFRRIQFTPDLLPGDLLGTQIYNPQSGEWTVREGPVFGNFLLADEINRAPAKVQSALLEAMQERQVTLAGDTRALPDPFLVLATQNPVEAEGTYSLPEAQVDRFMLKVVVDYPTKEEEIRIVQRMATNLNKPTVQTVASPEQVLAARELMDEVYTDPKIHAYVVDLADATRHPGHVGLDSLRPLILYGASPRASIALTQAARAHAFLDGRGFVTPHDVKAVAMDVLRHRVMTTYEAEAEGTTSVEVIQQVLDTVPYRDGRRMSFDHDVELAALLHEVRQIEVQSQRLVNGFLAGGYRSVFRGSGIEFEEVREYVPGDDPRAVDWNVTARTGHPYVKSYVDERELPVLFVLDLSASMSASFAAWSPRQVAARLCACLALSAVQNHDKVGLIACGPQVEEYVPARENVGHVLRIIRDCLALPHSRPHQLSARPGPRHPRHQGARHRLRPVGLPGHPRSRGPHPLRRQHDVVALRLLPPELVPPTAGLMRVRDPESGVVHLVDWNHAGVRDAYRQRVRDWRARTANDLRRAGVDGIDVPLPGSPTTDAISRPLLQFFRMRQLRGRQAMRCRAAVALLLLLLLPLASAGPAAADGELHVSTASDTVVPGKAFRLTVRRRWDEAGAVPPWDDAVLKPLVLRPAGLTRRKDAGQVEETREFEAYLFSLEDVTLDNGLVLRVLPEVDPAAPGPAELPGEPLPAPGASRWWWLTAVAVVAIGMFLLLRRRTSPAAATLPPAPLLPPAERALQRLAELRQRSPQGSAEVESFYHEAADLVREYVQEQLLARQRQRTSEELQAEIAPGLLPPEAEQVLRDHLQHCDAVKFAAAPSSATQREALLHAAGSFVQATRATAPADTTR